MGTLLSIWTVIVLILFVGIVIWAWHGKNRESFRQAARIPLEEEQTPDSVSEEDKEDSENG